MNWILLLTAVSINNPSDVPATVRLEYETKQQCELSLASMKVWIKFDSFKVVGRCQVKE